MPRDEATIDQALAGALRGEGVAAPFFDALDPAKVMVRIAYHGIAGLLSEHETFGKLPAAISAPVRDAARGQAMWELRHRALLRDLLAALAADGVVTILLKGTAVAYDLYATPSARARGDSDLLVAPADLDQTRAILLDLGYQAQRAENGDHGLQEGWLRTCDGGVRHFIDLHWQVLNAPALRDVLAVVQATTCPLALPRLAPHAFAPGRVFTLLHTCIHRTMHFTSPYFAGGQTHYGGDRLIWLNDIRLLAGALGDDEWNEFCDAAMGCGIAAPCLDGLATAQRLLAAPIPSTVIARLTQASGQASPTAYLGAHQARRAWHDVRSIAGLGRKLSYIRARSLPPPAFMRDKYPRLSGLPLPLLYARRWIELFRARRETPR